MKQQLNYTLWIGFLVSTILIYLFFSSGEFSFILTLACGIQCFGFGLVFVTISITKETSGLSKQTFICCAQALLARLFSILTFEGYLPSDATGDYVYRLFEILSLIFCILTAFSIKNNKQELFQWYYFTPIMLVTAYYVHPGLNSHSFCDISWVFALYMESFAILPQIHLFTKREGIIEYHTSNFVITQAINKVICVIFWFYSYEELNRSADESTISVAPWLSGYFVMVAQMISIIITTDFVYKYLQSWKQGIPLVMLPS
ncbi:unnamed protein product [Paramecium pentaurelia]|uniref:ER lumen protein-retaining receptor n=1 Tax=Paramecium pentaurelia TaxID=43138 RepID=A0A8S1WCQ0_9CILI|nr:unnamed protein product [Paramecium pentaurelia]